MSHRLFETDGVLHCRCADGELVTVLVKDGEPWADGYAAEGGIPLLRIVRSDGAVILEDVVDVRLVSLTVARGAGGGA